jgi:uncharacterized short protein YbdD (DUF466 family)
MSSSPASHTPQPSGPRRDASDLEQLFGTSAGGVAAGLRSDDKLGSTGVHCMIPGCPDAADVVALPAISLGSLDVLRAFAGDRRAKGAVWASLNCATRLLWIAWRFVRQVSGDDAYERYGEHMARVHPGQVTMTRSQYFSFCQDQKWNRVTRCC